MMRQLHLIVIIFMFHQLYQILQHRRFAINQQSFDLSFDEWLTARQTINNPVESQLSIGSSSKVSSLKFLVLAHRKDARGSVSSIRILKDA